MVTGLIPIFIDIKENTIETEYIATFVEAVSYFQWMGPITGFTIIILSLSIAILQEN